MQFASHFKELEQSIKLPSYLHTQDVDSEDENVDNSDVDSTNGFSYDLGDNSVPSTNFKNLGSTAQIYQMFCTAKLNCVFPNLYLLLKIIMTLPVSSVSTERSFSKLKVIKTKLRTTMNEDRLQNLMMISCESDLNINIENVIDRFSRKSQKLLKNLQF